MDWIVLAPNRNLLRAVVNVGSCRLAVQLAAPQEGLSSLELVR
jgi:hypothetical protein